MSLLRQVTYPSVRRAATTFTKHGITVPDVYQWLENPESEETKAFVDAQNKTFNEAISSFEKKDELKNHLTTLRNYARVGCPNRGKDDNEYYFYFNPGLLNQPRLMRLRNGLNSEPEVFLDPNLLSADGTSALGTTSWSESRRYFAHGISEKGSDWNTIYIKDAETNKMLSDCIKWVKYSGISWFQDPKTEKDIGFFYTRFPALDEKTDKGTETTKAENCAVYFHRLGESQEKDVCVLRDPKNPEFLIGVGVTDDSKYIYASFSNGCEKENMFWLAPVPETFVQDSTAGAEDKWNWIKIADNFDAEVEYISNEENKFWFKTNLKAPFYKIVSFELQGIENNSKNVFNAENTTVVIPEKTFPLEGVGVVGKNLILLYLEDVKHNMYITKLFDAPEANLKKIELPIGSLIGWSCRKNSPFVAIKLSSFVLPGRSLYFNLALDGSSPLPPTPQVWKDEGPEGFNGDDFVVEQHFYQSPSGARKVPMFVCRRKDVDYNQNRPTLLYFYGGFNISITPSFSVGNFVWMKYFDGVYACANIRGGGEYGAEWHDEGRKHKKANGFIDVCYAAKFLQNDLKVTNPKKICIQGGSNGGTVTVGSVLLEPSLFGAACCQVGVLDLMKFHQMGVGHAWKSDFNDPEVEEDFHVIRKISPLHNIRANVTYPPMLLVTADHDDRVSPNHSHKFTASIQQACPDIAINGPFLQRTDVNAGHGAGKSLAQVIDEQTDTFAFISLALGVSMK
jgi:prolyl oligopeptidase